VKLQRRQLLKLAGWAAAIILITLSAHGAWCQPQTTKPIKIVVAIPPGGAGDILARLLAEQISRTQGLSMVIENRSGAANIIRTEAVSHAAPHGNTLLLITPTFVLNPHLRKLNYDPFTSFESIC
jgi:tripartite-type tricarboxylate transporter receptor subunit TctC